jgi:hypothetical protein
MNPETEKKLLALAREIKELDKAIEPWHGA